VIERRAGESGRREWQRSFFKFLDSGDTIRIGFDLDRGSVTDFRVQLESWIDGRWRAITRYDTAHGFAHRDTLGWGGEVIDKSPLPREWDLTRAFNHAVHDLETQADTFRDEFVRRKP
jgi:hypothetical protein